MVVNRADQNQTETWIRKIVPILKKIDLFILVILVITINLPLLFGKIFYDFIYFPAAVQNNEFWRLFTHPFVHVSLYHFLLDASAFFLLYHNLEKKGIWQKIIILLGCGLGSLLAVRLFIPEVNQTGLCGLSGIAHGLMLITNLDLVKEKDSRSLGMILLAGLILKVIYEGISGKVFFHFIHFGMCGSPQAASHPGGVIGGALIYLAIY
ncbi:MAG: rhombosortase, partial [Spirochaetes bacterium]|nr:rhombosortase [Spirochaetota bacterium]